MALSLSHGNEHRRANTESTLKALILAAGNGTRLRPLTETIPKCLLPIAGVPLLSVWLELCAKHGITEALVNTHSNSAAVDEFISKYRGPITITVSNEPSLLGSGGTLYSNRRFFEGDAVFWILYADVLTNADLGLMLAHHHRLAQPATIGLYEVPNPRECGIVEVDSEGIVRSFVEKPPQPRGNLAFSGIMLATGELLKELPRDVRDIGFDVLPLFVNRMAGYRIKEFVMDIGTLEAYKTASQLWPPPNPGVKRDSKPC